MFHNDNSTPLGAFEFGLVRCKVRQIIGRAGYTSQDRKDLEQTLFARLVQALSSYDPQRGRRQAYVVTVIERAVATILRNARAKKRDHRRMGSLQIVIEVSENGAVELADTITYRELNRRRSREPRSMEEVAQLKSDLAEIMDRLPKEQRAVAEQLKSQSISAVARDLGLPRTSP